MLKILDGRSEFYQWDLNQKLIVSNPDVIEVHYCNQTDNCSLVCVVYEEDGQRLVDVPNILFHDALPIRAYAYTECCTKGSLVFTVKPRSKPADYAYTETEVRTWEKLDARITDLERGHSAILDVEKLPTEDILPKLLYRTPEGVYWFADGWHRIVDESELNTAVENEAKRIDEALSNEAKRIDTALSEETERATIAEEANAKAIAEEITRATEAEEVNATAIATETERATKAEQTNTDAISAEVKRATETEQALDKKIIDEIARQDKDIANATKTANEAKTTADTLDNTIQFALSHSTDTREMLNIEIQRSTEFDNAIETDFINVLANLNAILSSDDATLDELQEIVAYIKDNRDLITWITDSKVNVSDIVDNLLSLETNIPLSANQGRELKHLIDEFKFAYENKVMELELADANNKNAIQNEETRAKDAESVLTEAVATANEHAQNAVELATESLRVSTESNDRSKQTEANLTAENERATEAEAQIRSDLEITDAIAKGANVALAFANYETMVSVFNFLSPTAYRVGQNVLIGTLNVPDLWVSKTYNEHGYYDYSYEGDLGIKNELESKGYVRIGYYDLSPLETQKVEMTDYVKKTDYASTKTAGIIKVNTGGGTQWLTGGELYFNGTQSKDYNNATNNNFARARDSHYIARYGITRASTSNESVLKLDDTEKASAQKWLGVPSASKTYTYSDKGASVPLVIGSYDGFAYHQSYDTYSLEQIIGCKAVCLNGGMTYNYETISSDAMTIVDETADGITIKFDYYYLFMVYANGYQPSIAQKPFSKVGMYFGWYDNGDPFHIKQLTLNVIDEDKYGKKPNVIDFNNNDTSSPSHIHNRPCYLGENAESFADAPESAYTFTLVERNTISQKWCHIGYPKDYENAENELDTNWHRKFIDDFGRYTITVQLKCIGRGIEETRTYNLSDAEINSVAGGHIVKVKNEFYADAYLLIIYKASQFNEIYKSAFENGVYLGKIDYDDTDYWDTDISYVTRLSKMPVKKLPNAMLDLAGSAFLQMNLLNFKKAVIPPSNGNFILRTGMVAVVIASSYNALTVRTNVGGRLGDIGTSIIYVSDADPSTLTFDLVVVDLSGNNNTRRGTYTLSEPYGIGGSLVNTVVGGEDAYVYYLERG